MTGRKNIYFDQATVEYVEKYRQEQHLYSFTSALVTIINQHKHRHTDEKVLEGIENNRMKLDEILSLLTEQR